MEINAGSGVKPQDCDSREFRTRDIRLQFHTNNNDELPERQSVAINSLNLASEKWK